MSDEVEIRKCQHCGAITYDGTYKLVTPDGLSRETYCSHCDGLLWTTAPHTAGKGMSEYDRLSHKGATDE
jgi:hypothetical protein